MPFLEITHWDIAAFVVLLGVGYLIGYTVGRFQFVMYRLIKSLNRRGKK